MRKVETHLLRAMFLSDAFGASGNLTSDILGLCRQMKVTVNVLDSSTGFTITGHLGNEYLFGGTRNSSIVTIEMMSTKGKLDEMKQQILGLLENKKDNISFYDVPTESYIFDDDIEFPPK